jgi:hypothetical protein
VENLQNVLEIRENSDLDASTLIQPQLVNLDLRPGSEYHLPFTIGQSLEYPVDLYFLLDLSWSMNKSRFALAEQGAYMCIGSILGQGLINLIRHSPQLCTSSTYTASS